MRRPLLSFVAERAFIAFSAYRDSIVLGSNSNDSDDSGDWGVWDDWDEWDEWDDWDDGDDWDAFGRGG